MTNAKLWLAVAALALPLVASAAHAASTMPIVGLYDTGVDGSGAKLADGSAESHYTIDGSGTPYVYTNGLYLSDPNAKFIAAQTDGGYVVNPNTFALTFSLAGLNPATATLSGDFAADNYASVYLNGHLIAQDIQGTVYSNFQSLTPFSASSADFVAGVNTLSFVVTDTGPPSALLVTNLSGAAGAVPEPAAWALMLMGFGGLGLAMRARRTLSAT